MTYTRATSGRRPSQPPSSARTLREALGFGPPRRRHNPSPSARVGQHAGLRTKRVTPTTVNAALDRWWLAICAVACMMASDYKLRTRDVDSTLSGSPDLNVFLELITYGLVAVVVLRKGVLKRRLQPDRLLISLVAFGMVLVVSAGYATYPALGVVRGIQTLIVLCLGLCAVDAGRAHLHRFAHLFVFVTAASVIFGFVFKFPRRPLQLDRFNWLYVHPVIAATYLGIAVVVLAAFLLDPKLRGAYVAIPFPVYGALMAINGVGLLATKTRGGVLGAVIGVTAIIFLRSGMKRAFDATFVLAVASVAGAFVLGPKILEFAARGQNARTLSTLNSRTKLWSLAIDAVEKQPLQGYGLGASKGLFFDETGLGGGHNAFIEIAVDAGLIGFFSFVILLGFTIYRALRLYDGIGRTDRPLILGFMAFSLVNAMTTEGLGTVANMSNIWLFMIVPWVVVLGRTQGLSRFSRRSLSDTSRPQLGARR